LAQATEQLEEWRHFNHGPKQGSQILVYAEVSGIFEAQRREESLYKPGVICGVSSIEALKPRTDIAE